MIFKNKRCLDALDRAAGLWREDDMEGALKVLDEALAECPSHALLRMQKYYMEKVVELWSGIPRLDMPPHNSGDPTISVIMPTYSRNTWIRESVESVLKQTFSDWELIIVNDGGTSEVEEIASSYGDSRIRYIWAEHRGRAAALNVGLRHARGKYVAFLDDDDIYYPGHLSKLAAALEAHPDAPACYSDAVQADQNLEDGRHVIKVKKKARTFDFKLAPLKLRNYIACNTVLLRREGFIRCGGFNENLRCLMDRDMFVRVAAAGGDMVRMPGPTCEVRKRIDGTNVSSDPAFHHIYFSNILVTMHKGILFEGKNLSVWGKSSAVRGLSSFLDFCPDFVDRVDLREFFKIPKPYFYFMEIARKKGALTGDRKLERAALKAAALSAPYEVKLWFRLLKSAQKERKESTKDDKPINSG